MTIESNSGLMDGMTAEPMREFSLTISTLSGQQTTIEGIRPNDTLGSLVDAVVTDLAIPRALLLLFVGDRILSEQDMLRSFLDLGIDGSSDVKCLRNELPFQDRLVLWLRADDLVGDEIGEWPDASGFKRVLSQDDLEHRPRLQTAKLNDHNVVEFGGSGVHSFLTLGTDFLHFNGEGLTMVLVVHDVQGEGDNYCVSEGYPEPYSFGMLVQRSSTVVNTATRCGGKTSDAHHKELTAGHILLFEVKFGSHQQLELDGHVLLREQVSLSSLDKHFVRCNFPAPTNNHMGNGGPFTIGAQSKWFNRHCRFFRGGVAELCIYPCVLDTSQKNLVFESMSAKYCIDIANARDPILWLRADDVLNAEVSEWPDACGSGRMLRQEDVAHQPQLRRNILNGHHVVAFGGSGVHSFLTLGTDFLYFLGEGLTMVLVVYDVQGDGDNYCVSEGYPEPYSFGMLVQRSSTVVNTATRCGGKTSDAHHKDLTAGHILLFEVKFGSHQQLELDGRCLLREQVSLMSLDQNSVRCNFPAPTNNHMGNGGPFTIGAQSKWYNRHERFFRGGLAELCVYPCVLESKDKQGIVADLARKYEISLE